MPDLIVEWLGDHWEIGELAEVDGKQVATWESGGRRVYSGMLPPTVSKRPGAVLQRIARDNAGATRSFVEAPVPWLADLLQERRRTFSQAELKELAFGALRLPELGPEVWKSAWAALRRHPHVLVEGAKLAWSDQVLDKAVAPTPRAASSSSPSAPTADPFGVLATAASDALAESAAAVRRKEQIRNWLRQGLYAEVSPLAAVLVGEALDRAALEALPLTSVSPPLVPLYLKAVSAHPAPELVGRALAVVGDVPSLRRLRSWTEAPAGVLAGFAAALAEVPDPEDALGRGLSGAIALEVGPEALPPLFSAVVGLGGVSTPVLGDLLARPGAAEAVAAAAPDTLAPVLAGLGWDDPRRWEILQALLGSPVLGDPATWAGLSIAAARTAAAQDIWSVSPESAAVALGPLVDAAVEHGSPDGLADLLALQALSPDAVAPASFAQLWRGVAAGSDFHAAVVRELAAQPAPSL